MQLPRLAPFLPTLVRFPLRPRRLPRSEISARRKSQVGTGSRSEKIKTYNYKDTRMSGECGAHRWCRPWQRGACFAWELSAAYSDV